MDFQAQSESSKFLGFLGPPYKSFCALTTLKNGVIFLAVLDLIAGVYNFILLISALVNFFSWSYKFSYYYFQILTLLISSIGIIFSLIGLRGMKSVNIDEIELFYKFELVQVLLDSAIQLIRPTYGGTVFTNLFFEYIFRVIGIILSLLITKTIWSAVIRLQNNETVLVMHGEKVLFLMQQQAVNMSNPKIISPGSPIYFPSSHPA